MAGKEFQGKSHSTFFLQETTIWFNFWLNSKTAVLLDVILVKQKRVFYIFPWIFLRFFLFVFLELNKKVWPKLSKEVMT